MASAARVTIAEVEEVVKVGNITPEAVVTPGIFVQRVVKENTMTPPGLTREELAVEAAQELKMGTT